MSGPPSDPKPWRCYLCGMKAGDAFEPEEWSVWGDVHLECERDMSGPNIWSDRRDQRDGWAEE